MRLVDVSSSDFGGLLRELRRRLSPEGEVVSPASRQRTIAVFGVPLSPQEVVARICKDVAERGVDALLYYIEKLDGKSLSRSGIFVPEEDLKAAHQSVGREFLEVVRRVWARIERFQSAIRHRDVRITMPGGYLEERYRPISRVGVCVPGGAAAYPSTVLMTVVPARVAGVEEIVVATPPTAFGIL
jgi:histidinol dehydrogenase (EC 1.1.1.23)